MNKLAWIGILLVAIVAGVVVAGAVREWLYPQTFTIGAIEYTTYIEGESWANGTMIDWGTIYPDNTYYYNLTVTSLVPSNTTVTFHVVGLPTDYIQTWDCNNTLVSPLATVFGWLNLTVPSTAVEGSYTQSCIIKGEYT